MAEEPEPHARDADRLMYAGLLGLAVAGVLQLAEKGAGEPALLVAAYCFAAAVPLLAVGLVTDYARRAGRGVARWRAALGALGAAASVAGPDALMWQLGVGVWAVFTAGSVAGFFLVRSL